VCPSQVNDLSGFARGTDIDRDALRERLRRMTDAELIAFGTDMGATVYPRSYDYHGRPTVSAFSIQRDEARTEWRRRHRKQT
jgi:hypothetical protein